MRALAVAACVGAMTAGCAAPLKGAESPIPENQGWAAYKAQQRIGSYNLPRAVFAADLIAWSAESFAVRVYEPTLQPAPDSRVYLEYKRSVWADDAFRLDVDPKTGLLRGLNVVVSDQTTNILPQIAGAIAAGGALPASLGSLGMDLTEFGTLEEKPKPQPPSRCSVKSDQPRLLARVIFDPLSPRSGRQANEELEKALQGFVKSSKCEMPTNNSQLLEFPDLSKNETLELQLDELDAEKLRAERLEKIKAYCSRALCVPTMTPVNIRVRAPNGGSAEAVVNVPDSNQFAAVDIRRAALVTTTTQGTFDSGLLREVTYTKQSEALAVATLPIRIIRSALGSVSEVLQFRVNVNVAQKHLADGTGTAAAAKGGPDTAYTAPGAPAGPTAAGAATSTEPKVFLFAGSWDVPMTDIVPAPAQAPKK